ncbi:MAG: GNAT family N-acetyltransferase [Bradyrhizobiaceae bacterium]|nr:GNAT family N-acetyltransferase [Bradyrhizobiaceae bacterium]
MLHALRLRPYRPEDFEDTVDLWMRAWQMAMPEITFAKRLEWWRNRWQNDLVPNNTITIAELGDRPEGFIVINPNSGWLDQLAVEPVLWGHGVADKLIEEAKRIAPFGIRLDVNQTNARAIRFYERTGFVRAGEGVNPYSGKPTFLYEWKP